MLVCKYTQYSGKNEMKEMIIWSDKYWLDWVESYHTSDNKMGRPPSGSLICLSRVWLQTELDDTKSYYQFIIKITIFKKRITKLWRKGKSALKNTDKGVGSIIATLSCLVCVPLREEPSGPSGEERGLLSRTAAGDRA